MVSRRTILKSIGFLGLGTLTASQTHHLMAAGERQGATTTYKRWNGEPLARVTQEYQPARAEPNAEATITRDLFRNEILRVRKLARGEAVYRNNDLWLETQYGYVYASLVQPMHYHLPTTPTTDLGEGRWAELIVPYSEAFIRPDPHNEDLSKGLVYYGCVFRVKELVTGADGRAWYRIEEIYQTIYIRASHLRLIPEEDLTPLSTDVPGEEKTLRLDLSEQVLTAYEYDTPVWTHPVSSGIFMSDTPVGTHYVFDKRVSERMVASSASDDPAFYNLPGVPFVCYFTLGWVALHGTYWHNDFGRPRSHGCVNLPNDAARWLWRWTTPQAESSTLIEKTRYYNEGTKIIITQ